MLSYTLTFTSVVKSTKSHLENQFIGVPVAWLKTETSKLLKLYF